MLHWIAAFVLQVTPAVNAPPSPPQPGAGASTATVGLVPPSDWTVLPPLPYRAEPQMTPAMLTFVRDELRSGRCRPTPAALRRGTLTLNLAVLVGPNGFIRRVVPRAIDCMTVEQYGAGLVTSFARGNLRPRATGEAWHLATLVFGPPPRAGRNG